MEQEICLTHGQVSHNLLVARNLEKYVKELKYEGEAKLCN